MHDTLTTMRVPCGAFCGRTAPRRALFGKLCLVCLPAEQARPRVEAAAAVRRARPPKKARAEGGLVALFG